MMPVGTFLLGLGTDPKDQVFILSVAVPIAFFFWIIYKYGFKTDIPKIKGIPEMPGAVPFLGHLHLHAGASGVNDATLWTSWGKKLNSDLLQVKFGQNRVVIANTFDSIKEIFITNASKTTARPKQYVFEKYIGYDLGSHSLDHNFKQQRLAGIKAVQPRQWPSFYPGLDREANRLILNFAEEGKYGALPINPFKMMQIVAMNLAFQITFDKHFESVNDPWLREYIDNATLITKVRGASNTFSDFVPILRLHPKYRKMGDEGRIASEKRSKMVQAVLEGLKARLAAGEKPNCIAASVIADGEGSLTLASAIKCSTSMLQGGTESLPSHILAGMGGLISDRGIKIQEKAYQAIMEAYPNGDAAEHAFSEEGVPYVAAIYKEILRNYVVLPFSLPHEANEDIILKSGIVIPKGTRLYMNSEGGNHDEDRFGSDAGEFDPERWLRDPELNGPGIQFMSYGVGSRICPAWNIANRMMYGLLLRMILAFQLRKDESDPPPTSYETFGDTPSGVLNAPKQFRVKFIPRDINKLQSEIEKIKASGVRK